MGVVLIKMGVASIFRTPYITAEPPFKNSCIRHCNLVSFLLVSSHIAYVKYRLSCFSPQTHPSSLPPKQTNKQTNKQQTLHGLENDIGPTAAVLILSLYSLSLPTVMQTIHNSGFSGGGSEGVVALYMVQKYVYIWRLIYQCLITRPLGSSSVRSQSNSKYALTNPAPWQPATSTPVAT